MSRGGLWGLTTGRGLWGPELPGSINLFPVPLPSTKQSLTYLSGPSPFSRPWAPSPKLGWPRGGAASVG